MGSLLIKNSRIIDPANKVDKIADMYISDGIIEEISENIEKQADRVINAEGLCTLPGFVDLNTHLKEPGGEKHETIATGTLAAAIGGYTTVCAMPDTEPVTDNEIVVTYVKYKAEKEATVNVIPVGALTKGLEGDELADIGRMAQAGAGAFSEGIKSVKNASQMKIALNYSKMFGLPVLSICEDSQLAGKGSVNAGDNASLLGLKGISHDAEEIMVARDTILADSVKAQLHICSVSTKGSIDLIRFAKQKGVNVTCDIDPHHIALCDEDIKDYDANFKMRPPLRSKEDVECLKAALKEGVVDVIATAHTPVHADNKNCEFENASDGVVGLETSFAVCYTELVDKGILTLSELAEKMSLNPSKVLHIDKGTLGIGKTADITIIDPNEEYTVNTVGFVGKSNNSPFNGYNAKARVKYTIVNGKTVMEDRHDNR